MYVENASKNAYERWVDKVHTAQKMKFSIKNSSVNVTKSADTLNQKLNFLCSDMGIKHDGGRENNAIISKSLAFILFSKMFNSTKESFLVTNGTNSP